MTPRLPGFTLLAATAAAAACSRAPVASAPAPPAAAAPAMPAEVFAVARFPSLDILERDVGGFIGRVVPDQATWLHDMLADELPGTGIDRTRPLFVVFLAVPDADEPKGFIVLPTTADGYRPRTPEPDERTESRGPWAATGDTVAVDRAAAWALTALVVEPAPTAIRATLHVAPVAARWGDLLAAPLGASPLLHAVHGAAAGALAQSDRVDVEVAVAAGLATVDITLVPRPDTTLAAVFAAQRPSSLALFERILVGAPLGTMAGTLTLGPLGAPVRDLTAGLIASQLGDLSQVTLALFHKLWAAGTGEFAGVTLGPTVAVDLVGVTDAAAARSELDRMAAAMRDHRDDDSGRLDFQRTTHAGVPILAGSVLRPGETAAVNEATFQLAAWDDVVGITVGDPDGAAVRTAIDRTRGAPHVAPAYATVLADARRRGDSVIQTYQLTPDAPPVVIGMGVRNGAAYLHADVPADQVAGILRAAGGP